MNKKSPHVKIDEAIEEMGMAAAFSYFMHVRMKQRKEQKVFLEAIPNNQVANDAADAFIQETTDRAAAIKPNTEEMYKAIGVKR